MRENSPLPAWANGASMRARRALPGEVIAGRLADLEIATVRAHGPGAFLARSNVGRGTVEEIGHLLGGWEGEAAELARLRQERGEVLRRMAMLEREVLRLRRHLGLLRPDNARKHGND